MSSFFEKYNIPAIFDKLGLKEINSNLLKIGLVGFLLFTGVSCSDNDPHDTNPHDVYSPQTCSMDGKFEPGILGVAFVDSISTDFVKQFLIDLNLTAKFLNTDDEVIAWVKPLEGDLQSHIIRLAADSTVRLVWEVYFEGSPGHIIILFKTGVTRLAATAFLEQMAALKIARIAVSPKYGVVYVPEGKETEWAERLKVYPFVRFAEPSYYICAD